MVVRGIAGSAGNSLRFHSLEFHRAPMQSKARRRTVTMATPAAWRPAKRSARAARVRSHAGQSKEENGHNGDSWAFVARRGGPGLVYWDDWARSGVVREPPFSGILVPERGPIVLRIGPGFVCRFSPVFAGPLRCTGVASKRPVDHCFRLASCAIFHVFFVEKS